MSDKTKIVMDVYVREPTPSYRQISDETGVPVATVYRIVNRELGSDQPKSAAKISHSVTSSVEAPVVAKIDIAVPSQAKDKSGELKPVEVSLALFEQLELGVENALVFRLVDLIAKLTKQIDGAPAENKIYAAFCEATKNIEESDLDAISEYMWEQLELGTDITYDGFLRKLEYKYAIAINKIRAIAAQVAVDYDNR